ncbi:DUF1758 domain-containing protein [Nephila pilipes]|uniref:DUF1758 domain-containing protein n=1 Tax=Nephila pilipes TaxID=299642 RepID=A0A8X6PZU7_NEPPI|nr:DUF1758 domain-containing protein [Nephila pilipes]GFT94789.1 DUF1758 domain-containing protein [Nephila pilipes]
MENLIAYYRSDCSNVLFWIKKKDNWNIFVGNRVCEMQSLSDPENWKFLRGIMNPTDLPSCGCSAKDLVKSRWWEYPKWLKNPSEKCPNSEIFPDIEVIAKEKDKLRMSI